MQKTDTSKKINLSRLHLILILAGLLIIVIIAAIVINQRAKAAAELVPGQEYIQSLEQTDTAEIENEIRDIRIEKLKTDMESGEINVWQMFSDVAIVGDSRAEAFNSFEVLDSRHVAAKIGITVKGALADFDTFKSELTSVNPSSIILIFGLNDVEDKISVETYIKELMDLSNQLQETFPEATIYINSILPTTQHAIDKVAAYEDIPSWNDTVSAYCEENNVPYVDITDTVEAHTDLYEPDGIHMTKEFLEYWAMDIITEIMKNES